MEAVRCMEKEAVQVLVLEIEPVPLPMTPTGGFFLGLDDSEINLDGWSMDSLDSDESIYSEVVIEDESDLLGIDVLEGFGVIDWLRGEDLSWPNDWGDNLRQRIKRSVIAFGDQLFSGVFSDVVVDSAIDLQNEAEYIEEWHKWEEDYYYDLLDITPPLYKYIN